MKPREDLYTRIKPSEVPAPADLKRLREALDLSMTQAATMVHVNRSTWCRWESDDICIRAPMTMMAWDLFLHKTAPQRATLMRRVAKYEKTR